MLNPSPSPTPPLSSPIFTNHVSYVSESFSWYVLYMNTLTLHTCTLNTSTRGRGLVCIHGWLALPSSPQMQRQQLQQQEREEEEERLRIKAEEHQAQELARNRKMAEAERRKELVSQIPFHFLPPFHNPSLL